MKELFEQTLPFWHELTDKEQEVLLQNSYFQHLKKGSIIHQSNRECTGVEIIKSGQARLYSSSPNGGEITLFRLVDGDVCIFSAACMIKSLAIDTDMEMEQDTDICIIPTDVYNTLNEQNTAVKNYTLNIISEKFSEIMWLFNQYVFSNVAKRLADSLLEHRSLSDSDTLQITHETLAKDLGTAREVVTRLLKQFQIDGMVELARGKVKILDLKKLSQV